MVRNNCLILLAKGVKTFSTFLKMRYEFCTCELQPFLIVFAMILRSFSRYKFTRLQVVFTFLYESNSLVFYKFVFSSHCEMKMKSDVELLFWKKNFAVKCKCYPMIIFHCTYVRFLYGCRVHLFANQIHSFTLWRIKFLCKFVFSSHCKIKINCSRRRSFYCTWQSNTNCAYRPWNYGLVSDLSNDNSKFSHSTREWAV